MQLLNRVLLTESEHDSKIATKKVNNITYDTERFHLSVLPEHINRNSCEAFNQEVNSEYCRKFAFLLVKYYEIEAVIACKANVLSLRCVLND